MNTTMPVDSFMATSHPQRIMMGLAIGDPNSSIEEPYRPTWDEEPRLFDDRLAPKEVPEPPNEEEPDLPIPYWKIKQVDLRTQAQIEREARDERDLQHARSSIMELLYRYSRAHTVVQMHQILSIEESCVRKAVGLLSQDGMVRTANDIAWLDKEWRERMGVVLSY